MARCTKHCRRRLAIAADPDAAMVVAADMLAERMTAAVRATGRCNLALAGGSTPEGLYRLLAAGRYGIPWADVHLYFGDERCVEPDDPRSNAAMVGRTLLAGSAVTPASVNPVARALPAPRRAASDYARLIRERVACRPGLRVPSFDVVLLGLGADGHTASLFPDEPHLLRSRGLVVASAGEHGGCRRVSFTLKLINAAACVMMLAVGTAKAAAAARAYLGAAKDKNAPASAWVCPKNGELLFILDIEAAAEIPA